MWSMRSAVGRSSTSRAAVLRCPPLTIEFLNLIKRLNLIGTGQRGVRKPCHPLGPQWLGFCMVAAPLSRATSLPGFVDRLGFQHPQPVIGVENALLIDGLLAFFFQTAPRFAELPHTDRRV